MCVYKMQKKKSPQMAFFNCDDPSTKSMLERFNVKIFPTTVLFDKNMIPQISLVGASFS
jgi:thioredoxin-related protein